MFVSVFFKYLSTKETQKTISKERGTVDILATVDILVKTRVLASAFVVKLNKQVFQTLV